MTFPNLSSFRGVAFNEDTTSSRSQPAEPDQEPVTSVEHAAFSDINIIEAGGMGHNELSIDVVLAAANWAGFKAGKGQVGTLIVLGTTLSATALMTSLRNGRKAADSTFYTARATWVW